jgi:hypothetical protein
LQFGAKLSVSKREQFKTNNITNPCGTLSILEILWSATGRQVLHQHADALRRARGIVHIAVCGTAIPVPVVFKRRRHSATYLNIFFVL